MIGEKSVSLYTKATNATKLQKLTTKTLKHEHRRRERINFECSREEKQRLIVLVMFAVHQFISSSLIIHPNIHFSFCTALSESKVTETSVGGAV